MKKKEISQGNNNVTVIDKFFGKEHNTQVSSLKEKNISKQYFKSLSNNEFDIEDYIEEKTKCKYCNNGEMIPLSNEGILICNNCSNQICNFIDCEKPSYKEPPKEVCFYAYKRINHFREIIAQFQAKETTQISDEIIEKIRQQIQKREFQLKTSLINMLKIFLKDLI